MAKHLIEAACAALGIPVPENPDARAGDVLFKGTFERLGARIELSIFASGWLMVGDWADRVPFQLSLCGKSFCIQNIDTFSDASAPSLVELARMDSGEAPMTEAMRAFLRQLGGEVLDPPFRLEVTPETARH